MAALNELLSQINYTPIFDDATGVFTAYPYRSPQVRAADYLYKDDDLSVTYQGMQEELDLFNFPNKWIVVKSNPESEPLVSTYTNSNSDSSTSTVSRNRTIVYFREVSDVADQVTLDAYVQRIAFEASKVYGKIAFQTAIMPMHDYSDVLEIDYSPLGIKGKYAETSWSMPLHIGAKMSHQVKEGGYSMMQENEFVDLFKNKETEKIVQLGKVNSLYVSGRPSVIYDQDLLTNTLSKPLPYLSSYTPLANDRVMIVKGVIVGKII